MTYKDKLTFDDIEIGTILKIIYVDDYPMKEQHGRFLGILMNKEVAKEYLNEEGFAMDGFGILVEPLDNQKIITEDGKVTPFVLFPHTIKNLECYDNEEEYFKHFKTKDDTKKS